MALKITYFLRLLHRPGIISKHVVGIISQDIPVR